MSVGLSPLVYVNVSVCWFVIIIIVNVVCLLVCMHLCVRLFVSYVCIRFVYYIYVVGSACLPVHVLVYMALCM